MTTTLPAFRVIYTNGESYVTSMAAGVTVEEAAAYFEGQSFTVYEEEETGREISRTVKEVCKISTVTVEPGATLQPGVYEVQEYTHGTMYVRQAA